MRDKARRTESRSEHSTRDGKRSRRPSPATIAVVGGSAVLGAGLAIATKVLASRARSRPDPFAREPYGRIKPDRRYQVKTDGVQLNVDEMGPRSSKSGVVFLHGFCLDRTIWHHQMTTLDAGHRHLYYDARHHGISEGGEVPTDVAVLAADLKSVVDESGLERVVLVGHSMGGMTLLEFCRQYPAYLGEQVKGLVLVNTTYTDALKTVFGAEVIGPLERGSGQTFRVSRSSRANELLFHGGDLSYLLVKMFGFGPGPSPSQVQYVQRLLACFPSPPLIEMMTMFRNFDAEEALAKIDVPVLIVAGGDDRITTVRASRRIAADIEGSRLVVFDDTGHLSMMERSVEFNALLRDFFETHLRTD